MSAPKIKEQKLSRILRRKGYSIKEISEELSVSKGSVSTWVKNISLPQQAQNRLNERKKEARKAAQEALRNKKRNRLAQSKRKAQVVVEKVENTEEANKLLCAMIYWCEGVKDDSRVNFTNSDPKLISSFLKLFRENFDVEEKKFRVCIHLHNYHDKDEQIEYWSEITKIPESQFIKPYQKKSNGYRIRKNYQGCVNIRYHDARLAQDMLAIAKEYMKGSIG